MQGLLSALVRTFKDIELYLVSGFKSGIVYRAVRFSLNTVEYAEEGIVMKYVLRFLIGLVVLLAAAACAIVLLTFTPLSSTPVGQAFQGMIGVGQNAATNAAIDASGIKSQAEDALRENASSIAAETGMSEAEVNQAIDELNIQDWAVTSLPDDAQATGTQNVSYGGVNAQITTYTDPSYISVQAQGQTFTLSVPQSAQQYLPLLGYL